MNTKGFTVIEMLTIIVLMGVILAFGYNSMGMFAGRNRQNLRDVSTQFYRDYSLIRMAAIAQNIPMMIEFSPGPDSDDLLMYSFHRYDINSNSWVGYGLDSGKGVTERFCGPFVNSTNPNTRFAIDSNGMVVSPDDFNLPQSITFDLEIERISNNGEGKDVHEVEIFPSGGINVTKKLDQAL